MQYIVLTLGDAKHVTHSVPKSLNPEWNEQSQLSITGVNSLLLDVSCWDKDRFGKDYLGEFDVALEEIFANGKSQQEPKWFPLKSKKPGKKTSIVSGEVLLQFTLCDTANREATPQQVYDKFSAFAKSVAAEPSSRNPTPTLTPVLGPTRPTVKASGSSLSPPLSRRQSDNDEDEDYDVYEEDALEEGEDSSKPDTIEKRKRRLRIKGLKRRKRDNPYEFSNGGSDVVGIIYLEICNITDLPRESNFTKTGFDMDPFVVASLGKKTYRTKTIRHNLNPVYNEKMIFQVLNHEQAYSFAFTVIDRDHYSGNDFIASTSLSVKELIEKSPKADPETGLYNLREPPEYVPVQRPKFMRLGMSRTSSSQSLTKMNRPNLSKNSSTVSTTGQTLVSQSTATSAPPSAPTTAPPSQVPVEIVVPSVPAPVEGEMAPESDDGDFCTFPLQLKMKNLEKWEDKHNPQLFVRAKYMPYKALRQQFWRAILKQYDTDESSHISKVELTTMLDTLGSTLRESTIDSFFQRFSPPGSADEGRDMSMDEAVLCLEDQLDAKPKPITVAERLKAILPDADKVKNLLSVPGKAPASEDSSVSETWPGESQQSMASTVVVPEMGTPGEEGEVLDRDDLNTGSGEEHVVEIRECPVCHQPRLNKRSDADIITHIATCASQDWRQVNNIVMAGFVTASQAQRKWYSKVITKISYGGYKLGANSANILVQDRITGQINEEKMSVYVRLGIRLLYQGLKSGNMENKRSKWSKSWGPLSQRLY
jgi:phosphatidylserine decarboxylase